MKTLEELQYAHDNGFLSDEDFEQRKAALTTDTTPTSLLSTATQLAQQAIESDTAAELADGSKQLAKKVLQSDMAADLATGAAAGAVIASVVPLIGTGAGAIAGAALGAYKNLTKKP